MSNALIAIFQTLGANWFAALIIFLVLTLVWFVIGLTGYSLVQQLMALKIQNDFKQQAADAGLAPDAA